jgi:RNA polymerase sigma factor (TIGR02999 family)
MDTSKPSRSGRPGVLKSPSVTELLLAWGTQPEAREQLIPLVYQELRKQAARYLRRERRGHSLNATALVHEAFLRLIDTDVVAWQSRAHFFGVAARLMRQILVDHARARNAMKRGGGALQISVDDAQLPAGRAGLDLVRLDETLQSLSAVDERQGRVVELRFFGGLSVEETAAVLDVSPATVKRDWETARAWLYRELRRARPARPGVE